MANKIEAGIYEAKIIDYGIGTTKAGDPQMMILFEFNDLDNQRHEITWYGSVKSPKAQEITAKTLLYCGMTGNDPMEIADGVSTNILDAVTPVKITIELEPKQDGLGTFAKVAWVNRAGNGAFAKRLSKSEAKVKLGALNLKGTMMIARQDTGIQDKPRTAPPTGDYFKDDIGF